MIPDQLRKGPGDCPTAGPGSPLGFTAPMPIGHSSHAALGKEFLNLGNGCGVSLVTAT
jgi:hypothetical protein